MIPGPVQVVACPSCQGLAKYGTLESGNTFGAQVWTDGKQEAPMLPQPPAVVKCRHCDAYYWLADAAPVGELDPWDEDPLADVEDWSAVGENPLAVPESWRAAEYLEEPSEAEYYAALRAGLARDRQQERALRIFAWWRSNDPYRESEHAPEGHAPAGVSPESAERDENLLALLPLLDVSMDQDRVMRAEVLRELGRWGEAEGALLRVRAREFAPAVKQILELCRARDRLVRELRF